MPEPCFSGRGEGLESFPSPFPPGLCRVSLAPSWHLEKFGKQNFFGDFVYCSPAIARGRRKGGGLDRGGHKVESGGERGCPEGGPKTPQPEVGFLGPPERCWTYQANPAHPPSTFLAASVCLTDRQTNRWGHSQGLGPTKGWRPERVPSRTPWERTRSLGTCRTGGGGSPGPGALLWAQRTDCRTNDPGTLALRTLSGDSGGLGGPGRGTPCITASPQGHLDAIGKGGDGQEGREEETAEQEASEGGGAATLLPPLPPTATRARATAAPVLVCPPAGTC